VTDPVTWPTLSPLGRQIVITHELTHVATRSDTSARTPTWLSEGFAEWVGFRDSGIPSSIGAAALGTDVAAHGLPPRIPPDGAFTGGAQRLALAYDQAWLACEAIAGRYGVARLVAFYRAVGTSTAGSRQAVDAAAHRVLHTTPAGLTRLWHQRIRATFGLNAS
jgi:hypothetical protein